MEFLSSTATIYSHKYFVVIEGKKIRLQKNNAKRIAHVLDVMDTNSNGYWQISFTNSSNGFTALHTAFAKVGKKRMDIKGCGKFPITATLSQKN